MPIIHIQMLKGRTSAQKRALVRGVTAAFVDACDGDVSEVDILITEIAGDDWASGGMLCSESPQSDDE